MPSRLLAAASAFILLLVGAVAASPATAQAVERPNVGLRVVPLTITTADGRQHRYKVEVAATAEQQETGLMYRRSMPRDAGMIFPLGTARFASFWMSNTYIPLDIIFIAPGGRVLNIGRGKPRSLDLVESTGPVDTVLELNAGEAARIGLKPGDMVRW